MDARAGEPLVGDARRHDLTGRARRATDRASTAVHRAGRDRRDPAVVHFRLVESASDLGR
jgi:hypothetical protein